VSPTFGRLFASRQKRGTFFIYVFLTRVLRAKNNYRADSFFEKLHSPTVCILVLPCGSKMMFKFNCISN
jgi:hypothetical protein